MTAWWWSGAGASAAGQPAGDTAGVGVAWVVRGKGKLKRVEGCFVGLGCVGWVCGGVDVSMAFDIRTGVASLGS